MKFLHIHAHHDDFEFVAAGTFAHARKHHGSDFHGRLIVCMDGQAGHHLLSREETGELRAREQAASAQIAGLEFVQLRNATGEMFREACTLPDARLLSALWKEIREFEPDYIFCPPIPANPCIGVHPDHLTVAEAVRRVAYMINVPHAFSPEFPNKEPTPTPRKVPVILNVTDSYMEGEASFDFSVNVKPFFEQIVDMTWCHQSQISEWLPWVDRHGISAPKDRQDWANQLAKRFETIRSEFGIEDAGMFECFKITRWGAVAGPGRIARDLPFIREELRSS